MLIADGGVYGGCQGGPKWNPTRQAVLAIPAAKATVASSGGAMVRGGATLRATMPFCKPTTLPTKERAHALLHGTRNSPAPRGMNKVVGGWPVAWYRDGGGGLHVEVMT